MEVFKRIVVYYIHFVVFQVKMMLMDIPVDLRLLAQRTDSHLTQ